MIKSSPLILGLLACLFLTSSQRLVITSDLTDSIAYPLLGTLKIRTTQEITSSPISIGGETLDRDYANYHSYKGYLDSLGAKKIRLQAGWAKTEQEKGVYQWEWLDSIINDVVARDMEPWLQTSYGNPIYKGGGVANLAGGMPSSPEALQAWDQWVEAMASRYQDQVKIWEVWNEGDQPGSKASEYANLYIRTAEIIRKHIPDATLYALSLSKPYQPQYTEEFLRILKQKNKLDLIDDITFHGYVRNPSEAYAQLEPLKAVVARYDTAINLHQGEQGAPSTYLETGALHGYPWTETSQAKWALRRLMGDLGHGYQTLYFQMVDMNYGNNTTTHIKGVNTKGLLRTNPQNEVLYAKPSYYAVRNLTAVMDSSFRTIETENIQYQASLDSTLSVYGFRKADSDEQMATVWFSGKVPSDTTDFTSLDLTLTDFSFTDPVYVELMQGRVYEIPDADWKQTQAGAVFRQVPVSDYPILLIERELISVNTQ